MLHVNRLTSERWPMSAKHERDFLPEVSVILRCNHTCSIKILCGRRFWQTAGRRFGTKNHSDAQTNCRPEFWTQSLGQLFLMNNSRSIEWTAGRSFQWTANHLRFRRTVAKCMWFQRFSSLLINQEPFSRNFTLWIYMRMIHIGI